MRHNTFQQLGDQMLKKLAFITHYAILLINTNMNNSSYSILSKDIEGINRKQNFNRVNLKYKISLISLIQEIF